MWYSLFIGCLVGLAWRVEESIGDLFVSSVSGARLAVGWRDTPIWSDAVGQSLWERSHLHLQHAHTHKRVPHSFYDLSKTFNLNLILNACAAHSVVAVPLYLYYFYNIYSNDINYLTRGVVRPILPGERAPV